MSDQYRWIRNEVRRRVPAKWDADDISHDAWITSQRLPDRRIRHIVSDAIRDHYGTRLKWGISITAAPSSEMHRIASHYPSESSLIERYLDEETEDQIAEWKSIKASERRDRVIHSRKLLGTSCRPDDRLESVE